MTSIHHHLHHPHPHLPKSNTTSSSSSSSSAQACAACKYQRRKCAPDCILAPYFPHDRQRQFLNAHKLFGVSNITKIIKNLDPFQKEEAMRTIIFQSDARASDPVGGCYHIVKNLQRQLDHAHAELQIVNHHLAICKQQVAAAIMEPDHHHPIMSHGFDEHQFVDHQDIVEVVWPEIHDSGIISSSSNSSLHFEQPAPAAVSVHDSAHHQHHLLKFHDHHHLLHHSEEAMLKMDNVMLNEDSDPIQQAQDQDQDLKGAVDSLFSFPTNTT